MKPSTSKYFLIIGIIVLINVIGSFIHGYIDLTGDKRFTLTEPTVELVEKIPDVIFTRVYLDGEFPSGFKRLQEATRDILRDFNGLNVNFQYVFEDPSTGTTDEINQKHKILVDQGLIPTSLKFYDGKQYSQKTIFPYAVVQFGQRKVIVNLLEEQRAGQDEEIVLNNAVSLLEYKFANALQKIMMGERQTIAFTAGQGELDNSQTFMLERELKKYYNTGRMHLDSVLHIDSTINLIIVAGPQKPMSLQNQFKLDQYIMQGGKILWMVESLNASIDSIAKYQFYIPKENNTNLQDLLFKYGVRIQPDLIMDLESTSIPQIVGVSGDKPQTMMFKWPYHPLVSTRSNHPIVKNIDRVNMWFPSSIDTLPIADIQKTILLESSPYSRPQMSPMRLNFEILKTEVDPTKFNQGNIPVAVLLEGSFESFFKNRLTSDFRATLEQLNLSFIEKSKHTQQIIISDVDFMRNYINSRTGQPDEIGYNIWERTFFSGNKVFILNSIEYLLDESRILGARSKEVKLRLLDRVKAEKEAHKWQMINILLPLIFLAAFGLLFVYIRKRRFAK